MNITELKELAEKAPKGRWDVGSYYIWRGDDRWHPVHVQKRGLMAETKTAAMSAWVAAANPAAMLELIAKLEDAQGEIRALRATEAGLRDRLAAVEAEHAALLKAISDAEPVAWIDIEGTSNIVSAPRLYSDGSSSEASLYTLNGIKK